MLATDSQVKVLYWWCTTTTNKNKIIKIEIHQKYFFYKK